MFLETLDVRNNDILIYSKNIFDFDANFKIIFKKEKVRRARNISYFEVCEFVKDPTPKNLIVYRLLTNVSDLDSYSTKYGYFIRIEGRMELVYYDPVFAIKDLRHLRFNLDPSQFRFKVQQLGLSYQGKTELEANFGEQFSFDLSANESQHQNDKIFADAIFAFDNNFIDEEDEAILSASTYGGFVREDQQRQVIKKVAEDSSYKKKDLSKVRISGDERANDIRSNNISGLKQALGISSQPESQKFDYFKKEDSQLGFKSRGSSFSAFINEHKEEKNEEINDLSDLPDLFSLFKSANGKAGTKSPDGRGEVTLKLDDF